MTSYQNIGSNPWYDEIINSFRQFILYIFVSYWMEISNYIFLLLLHMKYGDINTYNNVFTNHNLMLVSLGWTDAAGCFDLVE